MKSIKNRYQLLTINGSGETNVGVDGNPGYIYVPYILQSSTTVISGGLK